MKLVNALISILFVLLITLSAMSADISVNLVPMKIEIDGTPGTSQVQTLEVNNESKVSKVKLRAFVGDLAQGEDGRYEIAKGGVTPLSAALWTSVDTDIFEVEPMSTKVLNITCKIPRTEKPGSRYAIIVVESADNEDQQSGYSSTEYKFQFATPLMVNIAADRVKKSLVIDTIQMLTSDDHPAIARYGKAALGVRTLVRNASLTHLGVYGTAVIRDVNGRRVADLDLGGGIILPNARVELGTIIPSLPIGKYSIDIRFKYGGAQPLQTKTQFIVGKESLEGGLLTSAKDINLSISPTSIETSISPGAFRGISTAIVNEGSEPITVKIGKSELTYDQDGDPVISEVISERSATNWIQLPEDEITLNPRQRKVISTQVSVPKDALGSYYSQLVFESKLAAGTSDQSTITQMPVIFTAGKSNDLIKAINFSTLSIVATNDIGWLIKASVKNIGNVHTKLSCLFQIRKIQKAKSSEGIEVVGPETYADIANIPLGQLPGYILAGETRDIQLNYEKPLEPGDYLIVADFVCDNGKHEIASTKISITK